MDGEKIPNMYKTHHHSFLGYEKKSKILSLSFVSDPTHANSKQAIRC